MNFRAEGAIGASTIRQPRPFRSGRLPLWNQEEGFSIQSELEFSNGLIRECKLILNKD